MPGFVKTPKDESKWSKAKAEAAKTTDKGSESFWRLSNYIFHKMSKAEELEKSSTSSSATKIPSTTSAARTGTQATSVRMPRTSTKMKTGFEKPSEFFKSENTKHPSLKKWEEFFNKKGSKIK